MRGARLLKVFLAAFILGGTLIGSSQAAVFKTVRSEGLGLIVADDLGAAFDQAKYAALRQAVEQAVGVLVSSHSRVANYVLIEDDILSRTAGFVRSYDIVSKERVDGANYRVVLDAEVDLASLNLHLDSIDSAGQSLSQIEQLVYDMGSPRIVYHERTSGLRAGAAIVETLKRQMPGLIIQVQTDTLDDAEIRLEIITATTGLPSVAIPFSASKLSDLGLYSAKARLQCQLYWQDHGHEIGTFTHEYVAVGPDSVSAQNLAVEGAVLIMVPSLVGALVENGHQLLYNGRQITLDVSGSGAALRTFERDFPALIGGIDRLVPRELDTEGGQYQALSRYAAFQVARELSLKGLDGMEVEIVAVSDNTLELNLIEGAP
jgi:hypothetical protein